MRSRFRRLAALVAAAGVLVLAAPAAAGPVARNDLEYRLYGRVFPDPQGGLPPGPGVSPFAKGKVPATSFLSFEEFEAGIRFLEKKFPDRMDVIRLDHLYGPDAMSAGLADSMGNRTRYPLYLVRVTDETVPDDRKQFLIFSLSIHGIERAGVEGGVRAIEDLVSAGPQDRLTLDPDSPTIHEALKKLVVYFAFPNPDGWKRGELLEGGLYYQRYNGNGVDLNRDWPTLGYTFRPYTPLSEPESRYLARALKDIRPRWAGGADLHGMLNAAAFTYTMLPAGEHDWAKNQRLLKLVRGLHDDAIRRLSWSPLIVPDDNPLPATSETVMYAQQWGTVWDTIQYTVTGALGDWINSPIGLDGLGLDNEMAFSHITFNNAFNPLIEQMHVEGNKSLIFAQMQAVLTELTPQERTFPVKGRVAYLYNPRVISHPGGGTPADPYRHLPPQKPITFSLVWPGEQEFHFDVLGPDQGVVNGGMEVTVRASGYRGVTPTVPRVEVWRQEGTQWVLVDRSYNQSSIYLQAGAIVSVNAPAPGRYKVVIASDLAPAPALVHGEIRFTRGQAWLEPPQAPYRVTSMKFFADLNKYASRKLEPVTFDDIASGRVDLDRYDTLVVVNDPFGGKAIDPKAPLARQYVNRLLDFVWRGGNLVLTDGAVRLLAHAGWLAHGDVQELKAYAGYVNVVNFNDPLARGLNPPGAAGDTRRQTYEPVPLGYSIDENSSPVWRVRQAAWERLGGRTVGTAGSGWTALGELRVFNRGVIRFVGALLPDPTEKFYHPFGLASYAVTWSGYQIFQNLLDWQRPSWGGSDEATAAGNGGTAGSAAGKLAALRLARLVR